MKKFLYHFTRISLKIYSRFYFCSLRVIGKENIPNKGGILFSPNHQNAFLDPILVGISCGKSLHSLTRSDVFGGFFQWFLDAMQTLPVYRIRDGYSSLKNNEAVFEKCYDLLSNQQHMMIFSEGKHHEHYYLQRLSKGSSRLAIEAQLRSSNTPVYLQPVGLNFENHRHAWTQCVVVYGQPIDLRDHIERYTQNNAHGLNALRAELQQRMEDCLWLPKDTPDYPAKKEFINRHNTRLHFSTLKEKLRKNPKVLKPKSRKTLLHSLLIFFFTLPNLPAHLGLFQLIKQFKDPVFHGSINFLGGLLIFVLWWLLGYFAFATNLNTLWGLSFLLLSFGSLFIRQFYITRSL